MIASRPRRVLRRLTSPLRPLPDYLVIGAMRSGTTSLHDYLTQHPDIDAPTHKEIHFFDLNYRRGLGWYRSHFSVRNRWPTGGRVGRLTGEATPYYLFHPAVAKRAAASLPGVKIVVVLRDPVERALSHYRHQVGHRHEPLSFADAISRESERLGPELLLLAADPDHDSEIHRRFSYFSRGLYMDHLAPWFTHVAPERILVLSTAELNAHTAQTYTRCLDFLGLPPFDATFPMLNQSPSLPDEIDQPVRQRLVDAYREPNNQLYDFLGRDLGWQR